MHLRFCLTKLTIQAHQAEHQYGITQQVQLEEAGTDMAWPQAGLIEAVLIVEH